MIKRVDITPERLEKYISLIYHSYFKKNKKVDLSTYNKIANHIRQLPDSDVVKNVFLKMQHELNNAERIHNNNVWVVAGAIAIVSMAISYFSLTNQVISYTISNVLNVSTASSLQISSSAFPPIMLVGICAIIAMGIFLFVVYRNSNKLLIFYRYILLIYNTKIT